MPSAASSLTVAAPARETTSVGDREGEVHAVDVLDACGSRAARGRRPSDARPVMCSTCQPAPSDARPRSRPIVRLIRRARRASRRSTSSVGRAASSPKKRGRLVAERGAVESLDLAAQRHADDLGAPRSGVPANATPTCRGAPRAEPVREPGLAFASWIDDGHALPARGEVGGRRRVAAEADDDVDAALAR